MGAKQLELEGVEQRWMTIRQAAIYTGLSTKTVHRKIASGELPAYFCGRRIVRVLREDLDKLMKRIPSAKDW